MVEKILSKIDSEKLDELNLSYYKSLLNKYFSQRKEAKKVKIFEGDRDENGYTLIFPTAIAPKEKLKQIPIVEYSKLIQNSEEYQKVAHSCVLWVKKMQAGTGSSMIRDTYLQNKLNISKEEVSIGSKGTDLFIDLKRKVSLAELQILQLLIEAKNDFYKKIVIHDIVSDETRSAVENIWSLDVYTENDKGSYNNLALQERYLDRFGPTIQAHLPTLTENQEVSFNRTAPGGHALFAVDALLATLNNKKLPVEPCESLVSVIGNGEDLSSSPSPEIVGWMCKEKVPIVMITTDKTPIDLKGGQISIAKDPSGEEYVTIIEQAQAKKSGQVELFEKIGLSVNGEGQKAYFNTNMALFNYEELIPKINKLVSEVGREEFINIISPDLISNWKEQVDSDGTARKYLQLEGAMGSSLLNLDRYWRSKFKEPLVHFLNVNSESRTDFFSPIKTAFDFFMQFHSDRFKLDLDTMKLKNLNPGKIPAVALNDKETKNAYYNDVWNVLEKFKGASIIELESLQVDGQFDFKNKILKGNLVFKYPNPRIHRE